MCIGVCIGWGAYKYISIVEEKWTLGRERNAKEESGEFVLKEWELGKAKMNFIYRI